MTTEENPEEELPAETAEGTEATEPADQAEEIEQGEAIEQTEDQSSASKPEEQLQAIIDEAKASRLSPSDEERAVQLLKQTIAGGPKALPAALDAILTLPWSASVKAVTDAWPETKPAGRTRLLTALAKADSDASRRIRLSLARGLHGQDAAAALKLITGVCEAMGGAQGGSSTKDRQIFANVMLGKARPWIMNISMTEMKPADAQKLISPALESCHQAPIFTQIWVLRWICDAEKFDTLTAEHIDSIGKSINRWQSRWHKELRKIIPKLPDSLEAALANNSPRHPAPPPPSAPQVPGEEVIFPPEAEAAAEALSEPSPEESRPAEHRPPGRSEAPQRSSRDRHAAPGPFDLTRSLREIESYVVRLRQELQQAQVAARRREPAPERQRGRVQQTGASAEELDELRRHNQQIEDQNQELRQRIEELTSDHEDRAATLEINDSLEQFKTFLGLKLKEDFADYSAISRESLNEVVRRHAHEILGRIFSILQSEGVRFDRQE
jgi:hypothetical protein